MFEASHLTEKKAEVKTETLLKKVTEQPKEAHVCKSDTVKRILLSAV
jgi:hypothetical protein